MSVEGDATGVGSMYFSFLSPANFNGKIFINKNSQNIWQILKCNTEIFKNFSFLFYFIFLFDDEVCKINRLTTLAVIE